MQLHFNTLKFVHSIPLAFYEPPDLFFMCSQTALSASVLRVALIWAEAFIDGGASKVEISSAITSDLWHWLKKKQQEEE